MATKKSVNALPSLKCGVDGCEMMFDDTGAGRRALGSHKRFKHGIKGKHAKNEPEVHFCPNCGLNLFAVKRVMELTQ